MAPDTTVFACRFRRLRPSVYVKVLAGSRRFKGSLFEERDARAALRHQNGERGARRAAPEHAEIERRTITIAGRAINTMLAASGQNDVMRIYFLTKRDGVDYNLAYIGADFKVPRGGFFNQAYMRALFDYGYQQALAGRLWHKTPPGLHTSRARR